MNFYYYEFKLIKKNCFSGVGGWGGEVGGGGKMDGQTNRPKPICPFNFFKAGGITMHKCTS